MGKQFSYVSDVVLLQSHPDPYCFLNAMAIQTIQSFFFKKIYNSRFKSQMICIIAISIG